MIQKVFLVDALADGPFSGSPTSVFFLESPMERFKMASLAAEMGSLESVYVLQHGEAFLLRFFTTAAEIKTGVHAALAAAHLIYELGMQPPSLPVLFLTQEGELKAHFLPPSLCSLKLDAEGSSDLSPEDISRWAPILGVSPADALWGVLTAGNTAVIAVGDHQLLKRLTPDIPELLKTGLAGAAVTSPGRAGGDADYCLRSFRPKVGVTEEHVSGSIHRSLAHVWGRRLGKTELTARQLSRRGGLVTLDAQSPGAVVFKGKSRTILRSDTVLESLVAPPAF
jgi:PhzF family phenazine biosynthesis protein